MSATEVLTILSILTIVGGFLVWLSKFVIKEIQVHLVAPFQIKIETMLKQVNEQIDKLTKVVEVLNKDSTLIKTNIATIESSTRSAHHRIDTIEERLDKHIEGSVQNGN